MKKSILPVENRSKVEGLLLVDKPRGKTSFSLIAALRKKLGIQKIGHAGTLDPFATGVMVLLVGRTFTRLSDRFLGQDKEYLAELKLGSSTDTYDCEGKILESSEKVPTVEEIYAALQNFQGEIEQTPPMFSAKKIQGKKLYELARKGKTIERPSQKVRVSTEFLNYAYPFVSLKISCSKGTYIRSLAHDLGQKMGCFAHLTNLRRQRSGSFYIHDCIDGKLLYSSEWDSNLLINALQTDHENFPNA